MTSFVRLSNKKLIHQRQTILCRPILRFMCLLLCAWISLMPLSSEAARVTDGIIAIVNNTVLTHSELQEAIQKEQEEIRKTFHGTRASSSVATTQV